MTTTHQRELAEDAEYRTGLEHIRYWNESCRRADIERGRTAKDIGRVEAIRYLCAHGREDLVEEA